MSHRVLRYCLILAVPVLAVIFIALLAPKSPFGGSHAPGTKNPAPGATSAVPETSLPDEPATPAKGAKAGKAGKSRGEGHSAQPARLSGVQVLTDTDPAELALAASRTLVSRAPTAILVVDSPGSATYPAAATAARALATAAGAPVLLVNPSVQAAARAEIDRLHAQSGIILASRGADMDPATLRRWFQDAAVVDPAKLVVDGEADSTDVNKVLKGKSGGPTAKGNKLVVLTDSALGAGGSIPASTAKAVGATVIDIPGADPRAYAQAVESIHDIKPAGVVGLGASFGSPEVLEPKIRTAATGVELPGGGQLVLPGKRYVALYGSPQVPSLGVLGEQDVPATIARAKQVAGQYTTLSTLPVVPTLEIIATVASGAPGPDGNYSNERSIDLIAPYVTAAREAGLYVVLDFQSGRTDFLAQVKQYEELVSQPGVGVALDPEWRLKPDQVHLTQIGSVSADEINAVGDYLADLVRTKALPQKAFVIHQFAKSMVVDRERLNTAHPELSVVLHVDGQGGQGAKASTWATLNAGAPAGVHWGWKDFYDEDKPMLTPEQTMQVRPTPDFISYQ